MELETVITCRNTGEKAHCRVIRIDPEDGKPKQFLCDSYMKLAGNKTDTGEVLPDEWRCADVWSVILQVENARAIHCNADALVSLRNETTVRQDEFLTAIKDQAPRQLLQEDRFGNAKIISL